jgi:putative hemolysin
LDLLLNDLKEKGHEIAVLLDEYGGTSGMVSQYDIIDSLLGGIAGGVSAHSGIHVLSDGNIIASGGVGISRLNWECGLDLPEELDDTLAGYVMRSLGMIPKPGVSFIENNYEFYVLKMDGNKVDTVRIKTVEN